MMDIKAERNLYLLFKEKKLYEGLFQTHRELEERNRPQLTIMEHLARFKKEQGFDIISVQ